MILIIGGAFQGKSAFAKSLADGCGGQVFAGVHQYIRQALLDGMEKEEIEQELLSRAAAGNMIFTADEIGYGIVPLDPFERKWREAAGRILCRLAAEAGEVYRVVAGIPQKIKG